MKKSLVYGPVPSRRLGRSLGVDLVQYKVCTFDCIYCQLGSTSATTLKRRSYVGADAVLADISRCLESGAAPDYITLAGSGEPTLNSSIKEVIKGIKAFSEIPVAVLTNGSLLGLPEVAESLLEADVVAPSLDAYDEKTFALINRPDPSISYDAVVSGLEAFRKVYSGSIWLEVFLVAGINDTPFAMSEFSSAIEPIRPDKIHVNTAVRPPAFPGTGRVDKKRLADLAAMLGNKAEVIAEFRAKGGQDDADSNIETKILNLLARRPCTIDGMAGGLNLHTAEILKYLDAMIQDGRVIILPAGEETYYQTKVETD
ncbi:MAG: radical SAM protein [Deltaproteobacteria bacterium]|nr:radical SAM protein [Deltaproteobacteria bacterium]